jgi:phospholipid/cholesterol/gamma-HCH transport system substrate-binding protein
MVVLIKFMRHNFLETIVGAIVLLVAGVFFAFSYQFSNHTKVPTILLSAYFDRADGVIVGSEVRMGGVNIGNVSEMTIDKNNFKACLKLNIDSSIKLPNDTSAEIISESLMGGKYINITPGSENDILKNGDKISFTQSSVSFESLLSKYIFSQPAATEKQ